MWPDSVDLCLFFLCIIISILADWSYVWQGTWTHTEGLITGISNNYYTWVSFLVNSRKGSSSSTVKKAYSVPAAQQLVSPWWLSLEQSLLVSVQGQNETVTNGICALTGAKGCHPCNSEWYWMIPSWQNTPSDRSNGSFDSSWCTTVSLPPKEMIWFILPWSWNAFLL